MPKSKYPTRFVTKRKEWILRRDKVVSECNNRFMEGIYCDGCRFSKNKNGYWEPFNKDIHEERICSQIDIINGILKTNIKALFAKQTEMMIELTKKNR